MKKYNSYNEALNAAKEFNREYPNTILIYRVQRESYSKGKYIKVIDRQFKTIEEFSFIYDSIIKVYIKTKAEDFIKVRCETSDDYIEELVLPLPIDESKVYNFIEELKLCIEEKRELLKKVLELCI
ncbi:MAG: hypothetical protein IKA83_02460 [Paludibacteraceae bacterium]|nr:hypothetical protein [Paludibacteraceae bacterium]